MKIVITGTPGFLDWHLQARLRAMSRHQVSPRAGALWEDLAPELADADAVVLLRPCDSPVGDDPAAGHREWAERLVGAIERSGGRPQIVLVQAHLSGADQHVDRDNAAVAGLLERAAERWHKPFADVVLPSVFGEEQRPARTAPVATLIDHLLRGSEPSLDDEPLAVLHAQRAAREILSALESPLGQQLPPVGTAVSTRSLWGRLGSFHRKYENGQLPHLVTGFDVELFNTYRASRFRHQQTVPIRITTDRRGRLVETAHWSGGAGQSFVSTTHPGNGRGDHFHLRTVERYVVLSGLARLSLRRVCTNELLRIELTGDEPVAVDLPTGWIHQLANIGPADLLTQLWISERHDPSDPDTFFEAVELAEAPASNSLATVGGC